MFRYYEKLLQSQSPFLTENIKTALLFATRLKWLGWDANFDCCQTQLEKRIEKHVHYELRTGNGLAVRGLPAFFRNFDHILGDKKLFAKTDR
jgi:hypothetical protein